MELSCGIIMYVVLVINEKPSQILLHASSHLVSLEFAYYAYDYVVSSY